MVVWSLPRPPDVRCTAKIGQVLHNKNDKFRYFRPGEAQRQGRDRAHGRNVRRARADIHKFLWDQGFSLPEQLKYRTIVEAFLYLKRFVLCSCVYKNCRCGRKKKLAFDTNKRMTGTYKANDLFSEMCFRIVSNYHLCKSLNSMSPRKNIFL